MHMKQNLTGTQRKELRGMAHHLNPVIQIGQMGISDKVIKHIDQLLQDHELIKIRFNDFKEERKELSALIAKRTFSELIGLIGNVAILYRPCPQAEKKKPALLSTSPQR